MIASSVADEAWAAEVTSGTDGPYLFVAEAALLYLDEAAVHQVVDLLTDRFPGCLLALDTAGPGFFDTQEQHDALSRVEARMRWHCPDVGTQLAHWSPGTETVASHTLTSLPAPLPAQLPLPYRQMVSALASQKLPQAEGYRLGLMRLPSDPPRLR
ncbi:hypothetical protein [Streptomyces sp. NPDC088254]|uniref:hypothetical protein n=1 Tax=Streptomyces sp. NPDC088254 TaxID=3365847 RepID=UPI00382C74B9